MTRGKIIVRIDTDQYYRLMIDTFHGHLLIRRLYFAFKTEPVYTNQRLATILGCPLYPPAVTLVHVFTTFL